MTTIAVTLIVTVFTAAFAGSITAICVLIALDGSTKKSREAADWQRIKGMFAEEREELTEERTITEKAAAEVLAIVAEARSGGRHQATGLSTMERVSAAVEARSTIGARAVRVWTGGDTTQEMRLEFDRLVATEVWPDGTNGYAIGDRSRLEQRRAA